MERAQPAELFGGASETEETRFADVTLADQEERLQAVMAETEALRADLSEQLRNIHRLHGDENSDQQSVTSDDTWITLDDTDAAPGGSEEQNRDASPPRSSNGQRVVTYQVAVDERRHPMQRQRDGRRDYASSCPSDRKAKQCREAPSRVYHGAVWNAEPIFWKRKRKLKE